MLKDVSPENILFLDIETVPAYPAYTDLPEADRKLWDKKAAQLVKDHETAADIYGRAGIYAEFGKIICISTGLVVSKAEERFFRIKSFFGIDEKILLADFAEMLTLEMIKQICRTE